MSCDHLSRQGITWKVLKGDMSVHHQMRQIKLSSPQMMQALEVPGVLEFLDGVGFVLCSKPLGEQRAPYEEMVPLEVALKPCNRQLISSSDRCVPGWRCR
eukprot:scaffold2920_cov19-Tisochrysis_lutea.AAC.1